MADVRAIASGNWTNTAIWNTGALPTSADDVWSNTFTITIDTSPTVLSVRNGSTTNVTAGGQFVATNGMTLTCTGAGVVAGGAAGQCFVTSLNAPQSCSIVGVVTSGTVSNSEAIRNTGTGTITISGNCFISATGGISNHHAVNNFSSGTVNINGNLLGGAGVSAAAINTSTGTINIVGNCTAGTSGGLGSHGAQNASSGSIAITGVCQGGSASASTGCGVTNDSLGTVTITGNCNGGSLNTGSAGARNNATGSMTITGTCAASTAPAANNSSTGILTITGTIQASGTAAGVTGTNAGQVTILTGPFLTSSNGISPVTCTRWFWQNATPPSTYYQIRSANLAVIRPLYTADSVGGNPAVTNVRSGTVYGPSNELTGTCAVPGAASVLSGVPVDNTTGTATISAASIRAAVGLASANLDTQLAGLSGGGGGGGPTAVQIRQEMDANSTKLANLDATISSRSTYAGGDTSGVTTLLSRLTNQRAGFLDNIGIPTPTSSENATAVWVRATSQLTTAGSIGKLLNDNINATISSRSTYAGGDTSGVTTLLDRLTSGRAANLDNLTTAPPSAADIASAVWTAGTRTLTTTIASAADIASAVWSAVTRTLTSNAAPSAADVATAVRTELGTELGRIDTTISSRLAPGGTLARVTLTDTTTTLTNAPSGAPSAASVAAAVRTELATELARLDAAISSRLATSGYSSAPTAAAVAAEVNSALDRTGFSLTSAERQAISTAVQAGILDESDGQAVVNALVAAIGNTNVDQVALVAAIRADLERQGGTLATRSTLTAAQVRTELTPELARVANCATTQEVGDIVEDALSS